MRATKAYTIVELVVVMFLVGVLSLTVLSSFQGGDTMAADRIAQADVDGALDAMTGASAVDGTPTDDLDRLADEVPEIDFVSGSTAADAVGEVSVNAAADWFFGAATYAADGACFMSRLSFAAGSDESTRLYAIILSGSTRACSGDQAMLLAPLAAQPDKGDSWSSPIVLT